MTLIRSLTLCLLAVLAAPLAAQHERPSDEAGEQAGAVNQMCPIGKEPIVPSAGTVAYKGHEIGLCCPGCGDQFLAWDNAKKDAFIVLAAAHREPGQEAESAPVAIEGPTFPYTLGECAVSGEAFGDDEPIVRMVGNREAKFCCKRCAGKFEADPAKYWEKVNTQLVGQQLMHYPFETCIVTGEKLGSDSVHHMYNNRLVTLANDEAVAAFDAEARRYFAEMDKRIIAAQLESYPMDSCPVGGELGGMGEPVNFVYMNRLVRFCCGGCEDDLTANPAAYMAKLDKAYADAQRDAYPLKTCVVGGGELGAKGEPVEIVAGTHLVRFCCSGCVGTFKADPQRFMAKLKE